MTSRIWYFSDKEKVNGQKMGERERESAQIAASDVDLKMKEVNAGLGS